MSQDQYMLLNHADTTTLNERHLNWYVLYIYPVSYRSRQIIHYPRYKKVAIVAPDTRK